MTLIRDCFAIAQAYSQDLKQSLAMTNDFLSLRGANATKQSRPKKTDCFAIAKINTQRMKQSLAMTGGEC
ncbi:MAG: hypothetical protein A3B10_01540 [Candidatus Doudnabacteria bacterium RIFCSPLOWO2_01_FULL_44_21]|uniref:Uncharacterized protein n=1 Tax=Candidatus Doudnabacteria bacterium RIFCSPLOWO2_01_FULL_44_21 TaxID=1817841 RepID=A0A1F5PX26_9BACT|nr:MAG: hypothetical protein A3B95_04445 [Candidatus Doudnabacteria bacterium RIFCSPHIGHO2_02_FULL_43_13b]OGE94465.1 MAG: hypothetical protein A3B10_01540 [Candidatus Doudnabacteria bacterium RIFCSPLOWO2_01_FULL_44_21]